MKIYNLTALTTAVQITPELRAGMLEYLTDNQTESEVIRLLKGVLNLHSRKTRDFLKYSDIQILNAFRLIYFYGTPPETAIEYAGHYGPAVIILRTLQGNNNAITAAIIRYRETAEQLEEIKTFLTGVHGIDPERVKLENRKGDEYRKLDMIEKKGDLERRLKEYQAMVRHAERVRAKLTEWTKTKAPEQIRDLIAKPNGYDLNEIDRLLMPYVDQITEYAGTNE